MAVYFGSDVRGHPTFGRPGYGGSVPNSGYMPGRRYGEAAPGSPGTSSRLSPADVGRMNPASVIDGKSLKGPDFTKAAFQLAQMFPKLVKLHPALRWADIARELWKMYRAGRFDRAKSKFLKHGMANVQVSPDMAGWTLVCDSGSDALYNVYRGMHYNVGGIGMPICGAAFLPDQPMAELGPWDHAGATEFWSHDFGPALGTKLRIKAQYEKGSPGGPALDPYEPAPASVSRMDFGPRVADHVLPVPGSPYFAEAPTWKSIPNREPGSHSDRGNSHPSEAAAPWNNTRTAVAMGGPAIGRVKTRSFEKERKFSLSADHAERLGKYSGLLGNVQGKLKDFKDLVEALHESLPEKLQKDRKSDDIGDTLANLYRHYDELQPVEAVLHILQEIAEDQIGGAGDVIKNEVAKRNGWSKQKLHLSPRQAQLNVKVFKPTWWNAKF